MRDWAIWFVMPFAVIGATVVGRWIGYYAHIRAEEIRFERACKHQLREDQARAAAEK